MVVRSNKEFESLPAFTRFMRFSCTAQKHAVAIKRQSLQWWLWLTVSCFFVFHLVKLQPFMTLKTNNKRLLRWNIRLMLHPVPQWALKLFAHPHLWPRKQQQACRGPPRTSLVSGIVYHMFLAITSRYVILPAGQSWQCNPCMKLYQLVGTSRVIIPQCIGAILWIYFFCIL